MLKPATLFVVPMLAYSAWIVRRGDAQSVKGIVAILFEHDIDFILLCLPMIIYMFLKSRRGVYYGTTLMSGKTVLITGGNKGIGYYTALDLAKRNAKVILACRSMERGNAAARKIRAITGNKQVSTMRVDMSSMADINRFAKDFKLQEGRLDVLINNAGITGIMNKEMTSEGLEKMMATNYFGPYLLTHKLLDHLTTSAPSRIIFVSSIAYRLTSGLDLENMNAEKSYNYAKIYYDSKLALLFLMKELVKRLERSDITVNCLHPGSVDTNLFDKFDFYLRWPLKTLSFLYFRTPEEGAQTSIYAAVAPELSNVTGKYFSECCEQSTGPLTKNNKDDEIAVKLYNQTSELLNMGGLYVRLTQLRRRQGGDFVSAADEIR